MSSVRTSDSSSSLRPMAANVKMPPSASDADTRSAAVLVAGDPWGRIEKA